MCSATLPHKQTACLYKANMHYVAILLSIQCKVFKGYIYKMIEQMETNVCLVPIDVFCYTSSQTNFCMFV